MADSVPCRLESPPILVQPVRGANPCGDNWRPGSPGPGRQL